MVKSAKLSASQDEGYSSCPLVTGYGKMVLAEFKYDNVRDSDPFVSKFVDTARETWSMWLLKKYGLPVLYWNRMMKGKMQRQRVRPIGGLRRAPFIRPGVCGCVHEIVNMREAVGAAVVGVRHIPFGQEHLDFASPFRSVSCKGGHIVEVARVHDQDEVVFLEILFLDLPRLLGRNFNAVATHFRLRTRVGRFAVVVAVGARRVDLDAEAFGLDVVTQQALGHGRAADVSEAHGEDAGRGSGGHGQCVCANIAPPFILPEVWIQKKTSRRRPLFVAL